MNFYALWITRNGQHLWSGPYHTRGDAERSLTHLMYCTGQRVTRAVPIPPEPAADDTVLSPGQAQNLWAPHAG